jgi:hypothetical protein
MKSILSCLTALAVLSTLAVVTPGAAGAAGAEWGLKAGVTGAKISGDLDDVADSRNRTGLTGGLSLAVPLAGETFALQAEALVVQKGATFDQSVDPLGLTTGVDGELELRYVEFPLLARVTLPVALPVKPFAVVGPSFGYTVDAVFKASGVPDRDLKDDIKKLDTSFVLGAGARLGLGTNALTLEARYMSSLADVQKDENAMLPMKNSLFTIMAGITF